MPHIPYNQIDPGIRNLCRIINETTLFETKFSCEGHVPPTRKGQTDYPWVSFRLLDTRQEVYGFLHRLNMEQKVGGVPYQVGVRLLEPGPIPEAEVWPRPYPDVTYSNGDKLAVKRHFIRHLQDEIPRLTAGSGARPSPPAVFGKP